MISCLPNSVEPKGFFLLLAKKITGPFDDRRTFCKRQNQCVDVTPQIQEGEGSIISTRGRGQGAVQGFVKMSNIFELGLGE